MQRLPSRRSLPILLFLQGLLALGSPAAAEPDGAAGCAVQEGFRNPPAACALQCWWHWMDDCGTLAYRPYRIEVPAGRRLEVRVVNTWPNRLIGDVLRRSRGEEPFTWTNWPEAWRDTDAPLPSGLIGPVTLYASRSASASPALLGVPMRRRIAQIAESFIVRVYWVAVGISTPGAACALIAASRMAATSIVSASGTREAPVAKNSSMASMR